MKNKLDNIIITEGIIGYYFYHLSYKDNFTKSLCGENVMKTELPLNSWGVVTPHIKEKYCAKCMDLYKELKNENKV